jgi:hypothetical protein
MNTKDIIQEAAEAYDGSGMSTDTFSGIVDFFLTHAKEKHGAELVKVEVDDEEVIDMLCWKIVKKEETIESIFDQALAIGREQGRKEAEQPIDFTKIGVDPKIFFKQKPPKTDL